MREENTGSALGFGKIVAAEVLHPGGEGEKTRRDDGDALLVFHGSDSQDGTGHFREVF